MNELVNREISEGRKVLFVIGQILFILGLLSIGSAFVSVALITSDIADTMGHMRSVGPRFVAGAAMFFLGRVMKGIGRAGLAGSGVILDPQRAREDLEPWSHMAGGMVKDGLDEAGIVVGTPVGRGGKFAERLRELHALHQEGILSDEEYAREKAEVLKQN